MDIVELRRFRLPDQSMGRARRVVLPLLAPLSVMYGGAIWLWRRLPARPVALGAPVVSVGSVLVGGTGKTPITMLLAKGLVRSGRRVCILSRGYRRKIKRSPLVVSDGRSLVATVEEAGDEPYLLARRLPEVGVVVSSDRVGAARHAAGAFGPDIFLLDDGFQVRGVAKDVEIVTVDAGALESRQAPLPLGRLREGWGSIKPNHLAVVLLARRGSKPARKCVGRLRTDKVFYAAREDPTVVASDGSRVDSGAVGEVPVLVVSGIASPAGFEETCRQAGLDARVSVRADDHHWYDQDDVALLARLMAEYGCQRLVTTEKDAAKLPGRLLESAWVVRADVALEEPGAFWSELRKRLGEKG